MFKPGSGANHGLYLHLPLMAFLLSFDHLAVGYWITLINMTVTSDVMCVCVCESGGKGLGEDRNYVKNE